MERRDEVRDFLTSRRERLTPEQAGIALYGGRRRVKGLRREEVAMLAEMSTDYYTRFERGNLSGASEPVLDSLARALQLDPAERTHLFDLAATANRSVSPAGSTSGRSRRSSPTRVRVGVQRILDSISTPSYVRNNRGDFLATNSLGRALFADAYSDAGTAFNLGRYLFLDPRSREFFVEWDRVARDSVAAMRIEAGRNPHDRGLTDLVGELLTRSDEFRTWWAAHDVRFHNTATKTLRNSVVGEIELTGEALVLPGDPGLTIITYTVEPDSPSEQALRLLASWNASHQPDGQPAGVPRDRTRRP